MGYLGRVHSWAQNRELTPDSEGEFEAAPANRLISAAARVRIVDSMSSRRLTNSRFRRAGSIEGWANMARTAVLVAASCAVGRVPRARLGRSAVVPAEGPRLEALTAALAWCDGSLRAARTVCIIDPDNAASQALAARVGFRPFARAPCKGGPLILFERSQGARAADAYPSAAAASGGPAPMTGRR